jgi:O6-methylguanine-DNA--protein-cysteine methyltransferase
MNSGSRILRADIDISGYRRGVERKRRLLEREVVA